MELYKVVRWNRNSAQSVARRSRYSTSTLRILTGINSATPSSDRAQVARRATVRSAYTRPDQRDGEGRQHLSRDVSDTSSYAVTASTRSVARYLPCNSC